ncbi:hypothetical protein ACFL16_00215 [Patescibacteria group bacterium]
MLDKDNSVFVYGTLRFALVRFWVYGGWKAEKKAVLRGFRKCGLNIIENITGDMIKGSDGRIDFEGK